MTDVLMPKLSDSMTHGTVLRWLVEEGRDVTRGEPLAEIESDKAIVAVESEWNGTVQQLVVEGEAVPVGALIARIGESGETHDPPVADPEAAFRPNSSALRAASAEHAPRGAILSGARRPPVSPVAKRLAGELGVELASLTGTGPGGRITKADVEAAERINRGLTNGPVVSTPSTAPDGNGAAKGETSRHEFTPIQRTVARRMAESRAMVPDFELRMDVDMTSAVELRTKLAGVVDPLPSFNDMMVKAAGLALRQFPRANAAYRDGYYELYGRVNIGVAVAAPQTLLVPTVFDADQKSLVEIGRETQALAAKARDGVIGPSDLSGGTFTVTNLGMYGIESFSPVINHPQAAILAVGMLSPKAVVGDGGVIEARHMVSLTLSCDHRVLYGAEGAQLLARIRDLLQRPLALLT